MPLIKIKNCLNCDGADHEYEFKMPRLKEIRDVIEGKAGMTTQEFLDGFGTLHGGALTALVLILHRRESKNLKWDDIDLILEDIDFDDLPEELAAAEAAEAAGKAETEAEEAAED